MAIPREAAPATVLPKSNIAQLGYQLGQQQQAREIAQADRLQGEMEKLGDLQFWEEVDSPVMGELTRIYIDEAAKVAKDPTNQRNRVRLARIGSQIETVAARSADDKKRHLANERFTMQMGRENVSGIDEWGQAVQMRASQPIKVEVDDNDNIRFNGQLADSFYGNIPSVSKARTPYTTEEFLKSVNVGMTTIQDGKVVTTSPKNAAMQISDRFRVLEDPKKTDLVLEFANMSEDEFARLPEDRQNYYIQQTVANLSAMKLRELDYSQREYGGGDGDARKDVRLTMIGDGSPIPLSVGGETVNVYGVSVPEFDMTPKGTEKGTRLYVNRVFTTPDRRHFASGQALTSRERELLEKVANRENLTEEEAQDYNLLMEVKSKPVVMEITGEDISVLYTGITDKDSRYRGTTDWRKKHQMLLQDAGYSPQSNEGESPLPYGKPPI